MSVRRYFLLVSSTLFANFINANNVIQYSNTTISIDKLSAISCDQSGQLCLSVGSEKNAKISNLQIYKSQNGGIDWSSPISLKKAPFESEFNNLNAKISCDASGQKCALVRVGKIRDQLTPMTYFTSDGGFTWNGPQIISNPTSFKKDYIEVGIKCNEDASSCIITTTSSNNRTFSSEVYILTQNGEQWQQSKPLTRVNGAESDSFLMDINCNNTGLHCTAVGFANVSNHFWENYKAIPVIYFTEDGGMNWQKPILSIKNGAFDKGSILTSVSCSATGGQCTVIGVEFKRNFTQTKYYSYTSMDRGLTWEGPWYFPKNTVVNAIDCGVSGINCQAAGTYIYSNDIFSELFKPIIYRSQNSGLNWEKMEDHDDLPIFSILTDIFCSKSQDYCSAVGFQYNTNAQNINHYQNMSLNSLNHLKDSIAVDQNTKPVE